MPRRDLLNIATLRAALNKPTMPVDETGKPAGALLLRDGCGLFAYIRPNGSGRWVAKFSVNGKHTSSGLGAVSIDGKYGGVTLAQARKAHDDLVAVLRTGIVPKPSVPVVRNKYMPPVQAPRGKLASEPSSKPERQHQPSLPYGKLPVLYAHLVSLGDDRCARALRFQILAGARPNEVVITDKGPGVTWEEIDLTTKTWTLAPERMKKERMHRVALSDEAIACLGTPGTGLIFGDLNQRDMGTADGGFLHGISRKLDLRDPNIKNLKTGEDRYITSHGFRSTFGTWGEDEGFDPTLIEMALAHQIKGAVTRAYLRSDRLADRRKLMEAWAIFATRDVA